MLATITIAIAIGSWLPLSGGTWSPDASMAAEAASELHAYVEQQASAKGLTLQQWPSYSFQYQGHELAGRRVLYINAFCGQPPAYAKKRLVRVLDGGTCYFSTYYDPVNKQFIGIVFNGDA